MSGEFFVVLRMVNTFPSILFFEGCIPKDSLHIRKAKGVGIFIYQILQFVGVMTAKLSVGLGEKKAPGTEM